MDEYRRKTDSADRKVLHRALSLRSIIGALRHTYFTHGIAFDTVLLCGHVSPFGWLFCEGSVSKPAGLIRGTGVAAMRFSVAINRTDKGSLAGPTGDSKRL